MKKSLAMTHMNECRIDQSKLKKVFDRFNIYISDGMTHENVYILG